MINVAVSWFVFICSFILCLLISIFSFSSSHSSSLSNILSFSLFFHFLMSQIQHCCSGSSSWNRLLQTCDTLCSGNSQAGKLFDWQLGEHIPQIGLSPLIICGLSSNWGAETDTAKMMMVEQLTLSYAESYVHLYLQSAVGIRFEWPWEELQLKTSPSLKPAPLQPSVLCLFSDQIGSGSVSLWTGRRWSELWCCSKLCHESKPATPWVHLSYNAR